MMLPGFGISKERICLTKDEVLKVMEIGDESD